MYRSLLTVLLCTISVTSAPQGAANSDITYVKIQPFTDDDGTSPKSTFRESRIENLPLTIPGDFNVRGNREAISEPEERDDIYREQNATKTEENITKDDKSLNLSKSENTTSKEDNTNKNENKATKRLNSQAKRESNPDDNPFVSDDSKRENSRSVRSEDTTASYEADTVEPTETITEREEELIQQTVQYETRTRAPTPRFFSKLSYFEKDKELRSSIATNLLERTGKRQYKTKCRCEKIWNCPKLQITVPRCPNEYFLCC